MVHWLEQLSGMSSFQKRKKKGIDIYSGFLNYKCLDN